MECHAEHGTEQQFLPCCIMAKFYGKLFCCTMANFMLMLPCYYPKEALMLKYSA